MELTARLREQLGIVEFTPVALDRFTGRDFTKEVDLLEIMLGCDPIEIEKAGLLVWADNRTQYSDQHRALVETLKSHFGEDYERYNAARGIVYASDTSRSLDSVNQVFGFLVNNKVEVKDGEEFTILFGPCKDVEEAMRKFNIHNQLTRNRLTDFYKDTRIPIFAADGYSVTGRRGFYEHWGGFCLSLNDPEGELFYASGWLHNNTNIVSIHGAKPKEEDSTEVTGRMNRFREATGIHPANLGILIYLKLGESLGHEEVKIRGSASPIHNRQGNDSQFYQIPRNYFRLRVNPESGNYEFDSKKRDAFLTKFACKSDIVATAFQKINEYMT